ncbi:MAG: hypothetical protein H6Q60_32 [Oscillospiraceae bacterium]|nr:hypothetical protein [Oscillospiraceae bacterium]
MTATEMLCFERCLSSAFCCGECRCRELRLTGEEAEYVQNAYPRACMTPLDESAGKRWYKISFPHHS